MNNSIEVINVRGYHGVKDSNYQNAYKEEKADSKENAGHSKALFCFVIIGACILNTAVLTLFPRSNSILYPEYWYEGLIAFIIGISIRASFNHILELYIFTKIRSLVTISHFIKVFLLFATFVAIPYCLSYFIWTLHMGHNHPLPFVGMLGLLSDLMINNVIFWFLFPTNLRSKQDVKQQAKGYLMYRIWLTLQMIPKEIMSIFAKRVPDSFQWTLALLIPLLQAFSCWVAEKNVQRIPETNNKEVKFMVRTVLTKTYISYVTTRLPSLTPSTIYCILGVDLFLHLVECFQIIKLNQRVDDGNRFTENHRRMERDAKVKVLVMSEFLEAMLPMTYGIAFTMAYYGPNAHLLKNVGNSYFGGKAIEEIQHFYVVFFQMFSIDIVAMILSGVSLKYFCRINLYQVFCEIMKKYWVIFVIKMPTVAQNFGYKDVNFGLDYTMKFLWTTEEGRFDLICNASELSNGEKGSSA